RINLQFQLGRYDNFQLLQSVALMRRIESDLEANRYQNAMRRRDITLEHLGTSQQLLSGQLHVQHDSTPIPTSRLDEEIGDLRDLPMPAAWESVMKQYYEKLSRCERVQRGDAGKAERPFTWRAPSRTCNKKGESTKLNYSRDNTASCAVPRLIVIVFSVRARRPCHATRGFFVARASCPCIHF